MNLRKRQSGQLMVIILGTLFLGGGIATGVYVSGKSIEAIRKDVRALRLDAHRQEKVYALIDRWQAIAEPAADDLAAHARALMNLMGQHDATRADFQRVMERQRQMFKDAEEKLLPLRDELRATLNRDEWDKAFQ